MNGKKKNTTDYESVKIKKSIVDQVRANKELTGVPVGVFFEKAAEEKLSESDYLSAMGSFLVNESNNKKK